MKSCIYLKILFLIFCLDGIEAKAQSSCRELFSLTAATPKITPLGSQEGVVYRVKSSDTDLVYKVFEELGDPEHEVETLHFLKELLDQVRPARLKVVDHVRLVTENEFGIWDVATEDPRRRHLPTYVHDFAPGKDINAILMDNKLSIITKKKILTEVQSEFDQIVDWLERHPQFRYRGYPVTYEVIEEGLTPIASLEGTFPVPLRIYVFATKFPIPGTEGLTPQAFVAASGNTTLAPNGNFIIFDPW
jgi:hypothetical protein